MSRSRVVGPLALEVHPEPLSICRLAADAEVPAWALGDHPFVSITRTSDELSVVVPTEVVPTTHASMRRDDGWRAIEIVGPFPFSDVGVLLQVAAPLADAGVSILPIATFDTDYVLVQAHRLATAVASLRAAGHTVVDAGG